RGGSTSGGLPTSAEIPYFVYGEGATRSLHSLPTRRSSDLPRTGRPRRPRPPAIPARTGPDAGGAVSTVPVPACRSARVAPVAPRDRKSTRLNSSHVKISYAVFCLKKKGALVIHSRHDSEKG